MHIAYLEQQHYSISMSRCSNLYCTYPCPASMRQVEPSFSPSIECESCTHPNGHLSDFHILFQSQTSVYWSTNFKSKAQLALFWVA